MEPEELAQLDFLNTELIENNDGSVDIEFGDDVQTETPRNYDHFNNIAEQLSDDDLDEIGRMVVDSFQSDKDTRSEWEQITLDCIDSLGLQIEEKSEPFEGACTATHPLILESVVKFQSKASNELLPASGPVKTKIIGMTNELIEKQSKRVKDDMNYHVQHVIEEFYSETEKALFFTAFIGNAFKKSYYDPTKLRVCNEFIFPDKIVVNNLAKSLKDAERISHWFYVNKRCMNDYMDNGYYIEYDDDELGQPGQPVCSEFEDRIREIQGISSESKMFDEVYTVIEQHRFLPIDANGKYNEDNKQLPYIVTVDLNSQKVLAIRRNWRQSDASQSRMDWFTHYQFVPTAGFHALGYAHLLGNLQKTLTLAMRSLADAGQFANLPAGFKNKTARIVGDNGPLAPGEFKDVEIPSTQKIADVFDVLPFKEPSTVLFSLMQELTAVGQKFADSTEQVIADSTNYGPVGTTMALLEASTRFFASAYKRCFQAQANEFKIISRLIYDYSNDQYEYFIDPEQQFSRSSDYDPNIIDIIPVADPNYSSQAQRISKAQIVLDTSLKFPDIHNRKQALKEFYKAFEIDDIDKLVPPEEKPEKREPLDDLYAMIRGMPTAAFKGQDHDSHIAVKTAWIQDPANGGNETMQQFQPMVLANIREHQFIKYLEEVGALEAQGMVVAEAAQRLARINQMAKEEQEQGSPAYMIAQAELIKAQTQRQKEDREAKQGTFKLGLDLLDHTAELEREVNRAREEGAKIDNDKVKMAIDLLKSGLQAAKSTNKDKK